MHKRIIFMRTRFGAAAKLALAAASLIGLSHNAYAQEAMPEGMIGWWYYGGPTGYAADPVTACKNSAMNHMGTQLLEMRVNENTPAPAYLCKYPHFISAGGVGWYAPTYLRCQSGYSPRWPGICTKIVEKPRPLTCSASAPGYALANPVVVSTGAKVQVEIDPLGIQQNSLQLTRTYRTFGEPGSSAGNGWSFSFDRKLVTSSNESGQPPSKVSGSADQGSYFIFNYTNGVYIPEATTSETLVPANAAYDEWIYKNTAGRIDYFKKINGTYRLTSSHTKEGVGQYFVYDPNNRLQTISDSFGRSLQVLWKNDYVVDSIAGSDLTVHYEYDQAEIPSSGPIPGTERLVKVKVNDAGGSPQTSKQYHYEDPRNRYLLTGITDENENRYATYAYDDFGQTVLSEHAGGADRHTFSYTSDTSRTITDPLGTERTINLSNVKSFGRVTATDQAGGAGCGPASSSFTYDTQGNLSSSTDFNGNKSCYAVDPVRNLETGRIEGVDAASVCPSIATTVLADDQRKVLTQWHPDARVKVKVAEPKKRTTYIYNGQPGMDGQILSCAPATSLPDGKPIAVVCEQIEQATSDDKGAAGFNAVPIGPERKWIFTYNAVGQMLTADGPLDESGINDKTVYTYYADTTATHTSGDPWTAINAKGHLTEFLEYNKSGQVTKIRNPNGQITALTYDPRLRLKSRTLASGSAAAQTTTYSYDGVGQLIKVSAPDASFITYGYDAAHRLTDITDALGNTVHFSLDNSGNRIREEVKDAGGNLTRQVIREYDALNRLRQVTGAVQ